MLQFIAVNLALLAIVMIGAVFSALAAFLVGVTDAGSGPFGMLALGTLALWATYRVSLAFFSVLERRINRRAH